MGDPGATGGRREGRTCNGRSSFVPLYMNCYIPAMTVNIGVNSVQISTHLDISNGNIYQCEHLLEVCGVSPSTPARNAAPDYQTDGRSLLWHRITTGKLFIWQIARWFARSPVFLVCRLTRSFAQLVRTPPDGFHCRCV